MTTLKSEGKAAERELAISPDDDDDEKDEGPVSIAAGDILYMLRFLAPFARPRRRGLLVIAATIVIDTAFNVSFPLVERYVIDDGLIARDWSVVVWALAFLGFAAVTASILGVLLDYLSARLFSQIVSDIRNSLFDRLQVLHVGFFQKTETGAILSRFSGDTATIEHALVSSIPWLVLPLIEVIYSTVIMFAFNVRMGLLAALVFPLTLFAPKIFVGRSFALAYEKRQREARLLGAVQENIAAQPVIRAFDLAPHARTRFGALGTIWCGTAFRFNFAGALVERSATTGIYLVHIAIFALGAYWVWTDTITLGTLVVFEGMFLTMGESLTYVTQIVPTLAQGAGSMRHLDEIFGARLEPGDAPDAIALPQFSRDIVFKNVSFTYRQERFRLRNIDLRIPKATYVALVGPSGSGKTTVLNLLMRFYDPNQGAILIDDHDIRAVTRQSLRSQIGMVFQDSFLFNSTVLENIRIGARDATLDQVRAAAADAEVDDFIISLPNCYESMIGEAGRQLSGGQKQRIAIARALVRDPAILILDEAMSALDHVTETALNATLRKIARTRTVISVTHRLVSAQDADQVIVFDRGRICEAGPHAELVQREGFYASFWRKQQRIPLCPPGPPR